jgi:hypothetical protein
VEGTAHLKILPDRIFAKRQNTSIDGITDFDFSDNLHIKEKYIHAQNMRILAAEIQKLNPYFCIHLQY